MPNLAQVWAVPSLPRGEPVELASGITIKSVHVEPPNEPQFPALLLQCRAASDDLADSPESDFRRLGQVLSRLSFSLLHPFQVFSARIIPTGLNEGDTVQELVFPGPPPGIGIAHFEVGHARSPCFNASFLGNPLEPEIESAISWFTFGGFARNSVQQVLCHWIGLECLTPAARGPWRCQACGREMHECPHCNASTENHRVVHSIRDYLENELGVSGREQKALYSLRCKISHGEVAMDPEAIHEATQLAFRIQELLLMGIKKRLGWPLDQPPLVSPEGAVGIGAVGLLCEATVSGANYYDQPAVFPS